MSKLPHSPTENETATLVDPEKLKPISDDKAGSKEKPLEEVEMFVKGKPGGGTGVSSAPTEFRTPEQQKTPMQKFWAVAFYWVISISLTFLNKTVMTGDFLDLDAPLFMSWTQFVMTVVCCVVMGMVGRRVKLFSFFPPFEYKLEKAKKILPLTVVFIGMIVFNNLCIKYVEVSFYYIARSLTIIFNIVMTYYILHKVTSKAAIGCCLLIIFGYALGVKSEVHFSTTGVFFGILSSVFVALNSIFAKKMFPVVNDSTELLMLYNNINAIVLLPVLMFFFTDEFNTLTLDSSWAVYQTGMFWTMILLTGLFGFLIGYASYIQVQYTSPLTHNVSGTAKSAFQTVIALFVYKNPTNFQNMLSVAIVLLSSFAYARVR